MCSTENYELRTFGVHQPGGVIAAKILKVLCFAFISKISFDSLKSLMSEKILLFFPPTKFLETIHVIDVRSFSKAQ